MHDLKQNLSKRTKWEIIFIEMLGTAFLVFGILASEGNRLIIVCFLYTLILLFGEISGAHFNPAVTIAFMIRKINKSTMSFGFKYIIAQLIGSFLGACLGSVLLFYFNAFDVDYSDGSKPIRYILAEFFGTYIFIFIIAVQTFYNEMKVIKEKIIGAAVIPLGLFLGTLFAKHTGGCLNPAVAIGMVQTGKIYYLRDIYIFIIGPLAGGILASLSCDYLYVKVYLKAKNEENIEMKSNPIFPEVDEEDQQLNIK